MRKLSAVLIIALVGLAWSAETAQAQNYSNGGGGYSRWAQGSYYYETPVYNYGWGQNGYGYYPSQMNYTYLGAANLNHFQQQSYNTNYVPFYYNTQRSRQRMWYSGNR